MADDTHVNWETLKEFPTHALALAEIERLRAQVADLVDAMLKAGVEW